MRSKHEQRLASGGQLGSGSSAGHHRAAAGPLDASLVGRLGVFVLQDFSRFLEHEDARECRGKCFESPDHFVSSSFLQRIAKRLVHLSPSYIIQDPSLFELLL